MHTAHGNKIARVVDADKLTLDIFLKALLGRGGAQFGGQVTAVIIAGYVSAGPADLSARNETCGGTQ